MEAFYGILIPFLGTSLGAACVFFMKTALSDRVQRMLTGFASGVMVAASIWSLLIPAIDQSAGMGALAFLPAFVGFWIGVLFLLALDHLIPHLHAGSDQTEGPSLGKNCASDHAMNAVGEMSALNRDLKAFYEENGADYPVWRELEREAGKYLK